MAYKKKTICKIINDINSGKMYLPAIQRKYVWKEEQIVNLMDSIMRNYPIGTFLIWNVRKKVINEKGYSMYSFIKDYHERDSFQNNLAPSPFYVTDNSDNIFAVLDGQQRLTSLYIALQGSLSLKLPRKQWKNDDAFPKKELFLNLHSGNIDEENENKFEFAFMTDKEATSKQNDKLWYKVKQILQYDSLSDIMKFVLTNEWTSDSIAISNLTNLYQCLKQDELINYFEIEEDSIDNVLDIFVRVNSGGTVLSKSDLLFSTVVSHWDKARDEIDELLCKINKIGQGFNFTNDFIMRSCLYILNLPITLKVENFERDSVLQIHKEWEHIKESIVNVVKLIDTYGFSRENIISYLAILPIVYYAYHNKLSDNSKNEFRKYLIVAQLKQIFGAASNSALTKIREELKKIHGDFSLKCLQNLRFTGDRTFNVTLTDIEEWFDTLQKGAYTFMILSLLYPELKYSQIKFHQDHMHPYSSFEKDKIKDINFDSDIILNNDKIIELQNNRNKLANLQLLKDDENEGKNDISLIDWLKKDNNNLSAKYLPNDVSYDIKNCEKFWCKRKSLMISKLKEILLG